MSEDNAPAQEPAAESGRVYRTVTRYWPRIAVGLVALAAFTEWIVGGLTADTSIELYLMAWAGVTSGLWFLSDTAEKTLSEESRTRVVNALRTPGVFSGLREVPIQFATLFDRVFGERHWSVKCIRRSFLASLCAFLVLLVWKFSGGWTPNGFNIDYDSALEAGGVFFARVALYVVVLNFIPDYLSLLQTRWFVSLLAQGRVAAGVVLLLDVVATATIAAVAMLIVNQIRLLSIAPITAFPSGDVTIPMGLEAVGPTFRILVSPGRSLDFNLVQISFMTAFFTSVWLWIYAASVMVSRVLVRMGGGVGFLLRVTDVEKQPFRSMGFTSVVLVSLLFLVGLPFVLLA
ncbi:hypothetical protein ACGF5M_03050 [Gemmatimonadota bacterium]